MSIPSPRGVPIKATDLLQRGEVARCVRFALILLSITDPGGSSVLKRVLPAASASRRKSDGGRAIARAVLPTSKVYRSGFENSFERAPEVHRSESGNAFERAPEVFKRDRVTQKGWRDLEYSYGQLDIGG